MNAMNWKILSSVIARALNGAPPSRRPCWRVISGRGPGSAAQQTIDLDASKNSDPVTGIDGPSARTSMGLYHKSFDAPPPTFTIINVNGGTAR
jgi:hypothetical protein